MTTFMLHEENGTYPEMCKLQSELDEGIRARPAPLNQAFPKVVEQTAMEVDIICDLLGQSVGLVNDGLALGREVGREGEMKEERETEMGSEKCSIKKGSRTELMEISDPRSIEAWSINNQLSLRCM